MSDDAPAAEFKDEDGLTRAFQTIGRWLEKHWLLTTMLVWIGLSLWLIWTKWLRIQYFGLGDTDDNLRMAQVRALLAGQDWFDLRQHRMNWPDGLNVHWSRLVDLPIAGLILILKPFVGTFWAERWAITIAPLLPLGVMMTALSLTARRLIGALAYPLTLIILISAAMAMGMFQPLRIDHHGWQLASVAVLLAGVVDPNRFRGGTLAGGATAFSLIIGLEMLPYLAIGGGALVLRWIWRAEERAKLIGYAAALAFGMALGFAVFVSNDNRAAVCDALSPVWFSTALVASAAMALLAFVRTSDWRIRLALALGAGIAIAAFFAGAWPHCLGRPENVSPELDKLWLSNVREAKPILSQGWKLQVNTLAIPLLGLIGVLTEIWLARGDPERRMRWIAAALMPIAGLVLLMWQTRGGPAAQVLATLPATALAWHFRGRLKIVLILIIVSGYLIQSGINRVPEKPASASDKRRNFANGQCPTITNLQTLNRLPAGRMLTFVDLGPRLIVTTHHDAVTGPYHRNAQAILDIHHFFDRDDKNAQEIVKRRAIDYVMICPDLNESTLYRARSPKGFYMTLAEGKAPGWLEPVEMPRGSPYKVWRVKF